jgi:predicted amidophosphoribosyltransferase
MLDALLPMRCPGCGARGGIVCAQCLHAARRARPLQPPPGVDWFVTCYAYEGVVRELVARAKYRDERAPLTVLGLAVAEAVARRSTAIDVVTWIPASVARRRRSGVDHGQHLARVVAGALHVPAARRLRRGTGPPQTGRDARTRRLGPNLRAIGTIPGSSVLVVDDVSTTGGSLSAAARVLRAQGAAAVFAATIAHTPLPVRA